MPFTPLIENHTQQTLVLPVGKHSAKHFYIYYVIWFTGDFWPETQIIFAHFKLVKIKGTVTGL